MHKCKCKYQFRTMTGFVICRCRFTNLFSPRVSSRSGCAMLHCLCLPAVFFPQETDNKTMWLCVWSLWQTDSSEWINDSTKSGSQRAPENPQCFCDAVLIMGTLWPHVTVACSSCFTMNKSIDVKYSREMICSDKAEFWFKLSPRKTRRINFLFFSLSHC